MNNRIMDREVLREDYFESKGKYPSNNWLDSAMKLMDDMHKGYANVDGNDSGKNDELHQLLVRQEFLDGVISHLVNEFNKGQDKLSFITGMGFRYYYCQDTDSKEE